MGNINGIRVNKGQFGRRNYFIQFI